jgi:phosphatidylserine/phosphatidylglycerophosphate/cardiolipin synthase-like enzyme
VRVIIQPDDGVAPLIKAITRARKSIDIVVFRFDVDAIEEALTAAVKRGVVVRA